MAAKTMLISNITDGVCLVACLASALMVIHCGGDIVVRGVYGYHHDVKLCHILLYDNKVTVADIGLARVAEEKDID